MQRKTKIVATISSLNCDVVFLEKLFRSGMDVVRLNTAHMDHKDALQVIRNVRAVSERIGILIDTKGPEIRTCSSRGSLTVKSGDRIRIKGAPEEQSSGDLVCVSHAGFVDDVPVGSAILIDDGLIGLTAVEREGDALVCVVENDGVITEHKSINIPSVHVTLPALSEKDKAFIAFAADNDLDFIAHSFVRNRADVLAVQNILDNKRSDIKIIAKIENAEGVAHLSEILDVCYGVMVARGDLAVEIPIEQIPLVQKKIVRECIVRHKPVIVATQMLHSMIDSPRPTRAEVSDVANACLDHTDALMLSGETANGKYPEAAVQIMAKIAEEVEGTKKIDVDIPFTREDKVATYLANAAVRAAESLKTKAIVADSTSGRSILALAAYRGPNVIYAQVYDQKVARQLSLSYGVYAKYTSMVAPDKQLYSWICQLIVEKRMRRDDLVVVLAGNFGVQAGASYVEIAPAEHIERLYCGS